MSSRPTRNSRIPIRLAKLGALWAFAVLLAPARAQPWGCAGHQTVALIAEKHLNARALRGVNDLLKSEPIDPNLRRFCASQGLGLIADAATWADDVRGERPETAPWHFVDIPRGALRNAVSAACPSSTGCVTGEIRKELRVLRAADSSPRVRAEALRFVIHFVGDIHQPLHCTTNNDQGGNCVPVSYFGNPPLLANPDKPDREDYRPNLHAVWDSSIIERMQDGASVEQRAASIDQKFSAKISGWQRGGVRTENWAWESHQLAEATTYGRLPTPIPVENPEPVHTCSDDNRVSRRMLALDEQLLQPYQDATAPVIEEQLAKAGARLAMILNQVWP